VPTNYNINYDISFDIAPTIHENSTYVHAIPTSVTNTFGGFYTHLPNASTINTKYTIKKFLSCSALSLVFKRIILSLSSHTESQTYNEASKHDYWT